VRLLRERRGSGLAGCMSRCPAFGVTGKGRHMKNKEEEGIIKGTGRDSAGTGHRFPFGEPVRRVEQTDRRPKRLFVLGVYASAVHARWVDLQGKTLVAALAVASEPYIFWRGDGAEDTISRIQVPAGLGRLEPVSPKLNGPSGKALDELFLAPLGHATREEVWCCDLVPHSCLNPKQGAAIDRAYRPVMVKFGLPEPSVPQVPGNLTDATRREEIAAELALSKAERVVLLGDEPIRWFTSHYDSRWKRLADFGEPYGREHEIKIEGTPYAVIPLAHPRQVAGLGSHSPKWRSCHERWMKAR